MNFVHSQYGRKMKMNTIVTSKEEILCVSRELIRKQGWNALNIRTVAKECNISVGSIYNYFRNKSDLITATVESVWHDIFHFPENPAVFDSFIRCVEWAFDSMKKGEERYPGFFAFHSVIFMGEEKGNGQQLMQESWKHISEGLYQVLLHDPNVSSFAFDDEFTPQKFVEIIFSLIIAAMIRHDYDCLGITGMIRRTIYTKN